MRFSTTILVLLLFLLPYSATSRTDEFTNVPDSISALLKQADQEEDNNLSAAIGHIDQVIAWADNTNNTPVLF